MWLHQPHAQIEFLAWARHYTKTSGHHVIEGLLCERESHREERDRYQHTDVLPCDQTEHKVHQQHWAGNPSLQESNLRRSPQRMWELRYVLKNDQEFTWKNLREEWRMGVNFNENMAYTEVTEAHSLSVVSVKDMGDTMRLAECDNWVGTEALGLQPPSHRKPSRDEWKQGSEVFVIDKSRFGLWLLSSFSAVICIVMMSSYKVWSKPTPSPGQMTYRSRI